MERAPLPPHERTWRHPSELGSAQPEADTSDQRRAATLAGGTLAVMLVAALVVAMTPRGTASPVAVSATTAPVVQLAIRSAETAGLDGALNSFQPARLASFTGIPNAIAAIPALPFHILDNDATLAVSSAILPDLNDQVLVVTEHYAYAVRWRDVAWLTFADDALVLGADGSVVARFAGGRLIVMTDTRVGSPLALTSSAAD